MAESAGVTIRFRYADIPIYARRPPAWGGQRFAAAVRDC
jgi:hypothetical protein